MKHDNELLAERQAERQAERLDDLLAQPHAAPPALAKRILDDLPPQSRWRRFLDSALPSAWQGGLWRPAAAALAPLALGFALGLGSGIPDEDPLYDDVLMLAFSDSYFETNGDYSDE